MHKQIASMVPDLFENRKGAFIVNTVKKQIRLDSLEQRESLLEILESLGIRMIVPGRFSGTSEQTENLFTLCEDLTKSLRRK